MKDDRKIRPALITSLTEMRGQAQARIDAAPAGATEVADMTAAHLVLDAAVVAQCGSVLATLENLPLPCEMVYDAYLRCDLDIRQQGGPLEHPRLYAWTLVGALALAPVFDRQEKGL